MKMQEKLKASCITEVVWRFDVHIVVLTLLSSGMGCCILWQMGREVTMAAD
jgi:hypothetical protein